MQTPNTSERSRQSVQDTETRGSTKSSSLSSESPPSEYDGDLVYVMVDGKLTYAGCIPAHDVKI